MKAAVYWKMAWLRATIYLLIVGVTTFLTLTETFSDKTWLEMGFFLKARLVAQCFVSAFTTLVAFLDTTMSSLRNGKQIPEPPAPRGPAL